MTTYAFQWLRGDANSPISGADQQGYIPTPADVGYKLFVSVTAYNLAGASLAAISQGIGPIAAMAGDDAPIWASGSTAIVPEGVTGTIFTMSAIDPEGSGITYSLGGADAGLFNFNPITGAISFKSVPDFEPTGYKSAAGTNVYSLTQMATDGTNPVTKPLTITVVNVFEVILAGVTVALTPNLPSSVPAGTVVATISGRVANDVLALSQAMLDAGFVLTANQIKVGASAWGPGPLNGAVTQSHPDASVPVTTNFTINTAVVVTNNPPVWTSANTVSVAENTSGVFYTGTATDPEGNSLTYAIAGGADAARFSITAAGALKFVAAPDYEPAGYKSVAGTNVYTVILSVSDGTNAAVTRTLTVTVTNVFEVVLAGVTVTPVAGLTGPQPADTVLANITGRVVGDDLTLTGALATAGAYLNSAKTQIKVGPAGLGNGSYARIVTQSHPDASATSVNTGVTVIGAGTPLMSIDNSTVATSWSTQQVGIFNLTNAPAGSFVRLRDENAGFAIVEG